MNNIFKVSLAVTALVGLGSNVVVGQNTTKGGTEFDLQLNTITTAVPFLLIAPDARAGGLGDAGVASSPDANSIHWNSAKLAFMNKDEKMGVAMSYTPWLRALVPDINLAYLSFYNKIDDQQAFGASLRYFSLGDITFTDNVGNETGQFRPNEFALDVAYARKFSDYISGGLTFRYIYSNLTGGFVVQGAASKPGRAVAADISSFYHNPDIELFGKDAILGVGINISNIGTKIAYTETGESDFIPINLRFGTSLEFELDDYNRIGWLLDFNKLLVPTPPAYDADGFISSGKDPDRSVVSGMFGSFNDAPGGGKEEFRELTLSTGLEYWYDNQFAVRAGYFYEHPSKGNRKYLTLGAGIKYNVFGLDFAYLIPTEQRHPLENTLRFTLLFDFAAFDKQNSEGSSTD